MKRLKKVIIFILIISLTSCLSLTEKAGKVLDGSVFKEKTISRYKASKKDGALVNIEIHVTQNKNNSQFIIISLADFPMMKLRASFTEQNDIINFISLEYLAGTTHGWNEYTLELMGEGTLSFENGAVLKAFEFEKIQISSGRIHRYDTRITGNEALTGLRNRNERIHVMVEWMHSINEAPKEQLTLEKFKDYWYPILFPEMVKKRKKPENWKQNEDIFSRADGIRWNTGYTQRLFSEELHPVRNSGTMLRDWEEALPWIFMEYNWDYIMGIFTNDIEFTKMK